jgi:hypothetical protein
MHEWRVCVSPLVFLQAHRETEVHFTAAGMPSQCNQSDSFQARGILPVAEEQSRTRVAGPLKQRHYGLTSMSRAVA